MKTPLALILGTLALTLCLSTTAVAATGTAHIRGTVEDSELSGELSFEDTPAGLKISGNLEKVAMGEHGFHIHEFGDCSDEGKAAGSHFNPDSKPHGHAMRDGTKNVHPGDMGNVNVGADGKANVDVVLPNVTLSSGKYSVAGRAVVLHEKKDDFGQPTGNAGGRIGCGPILLTGKQMAK
jgi:Cu-Zn family superoxide dismutase